MPAAWRNTS